jgi:hypothetical protein
MLGGPTTVLVPPTRMHASAPSYCRVELHGRGAHDWYAACLTGEGLQPVADARTLPISAGASVDWM